jgi:hypothetical protein
MVLSTDQISADWQPRTQNILINPRTFERVHQSKLRRQSTLDLLHVSTPRLIMAAIQPQSLIRNGIVQPRLRWQGHA